MQNAKSPQKRCQKLFLLSALQLSIPQPGGECCSDFWVRWRQEIPHITHLLFPGVPPLLPLHLPTAPRNADLFSQLEGFVPNATCTSSFNSAPPVVCVSEHRLGRKIKSTPSNQRRHPVPKHFFVNVDYADLRHFPSEND